MRRLLKIMVPVGALTLILAYAWYVVLPGWGGPPQSIATPPLSGAFAVGRTRFDWLDAARQRELMVWVWYPANQNSLGTSSSYLPGRWGELASAWEARNINLRVVAQPFSWPKLWSALTFHPPLSAVSLQRLQIHALDNAQWADAPRNFPVLFFSPGLGMMPTDYTALIEDIASHGYVVVGINPTGYTASTVFADGRQAGLRPPWEINPAAASMLDTWVTDMRFALDQMTQISADPLSTTIASDQSAGGALRGQQIVRNVPARSAEGRSLEAAISPSPAADTIR